MKQTFKKTERLCSKKTIDRLFKKGSTDVRSFYLFPFKVFYISETVEAASPFPQVLFSVSKRYFKKAVDRNLIRRRCKEAYRLNKQALIEKLDKNQYLAIAFVYIGKEAAHYELIEKSIQKLLKWLP